MQIGLKCQSRFSGKNKKKNIINLSSAEFAWRVIEVSNLSYKRNPAVHCDFRNQYK